MPEGGREDEVTVRTDPTPTQVEECRRGLASYNRRFVPGKSSPFAVVLLDEEGETVVGGVTGSTYWERMHIDMLWVCESHRGRGYGEKLLEAAEEIARERGCRGIDLDTMSFQAPGFYRKMGFTLVGSVPGFAGGHTRFYFSKELR